MSQDKAIRAFVDYAKKTGDYAKAEADWGSRDEPVLDKYEARYAAKKDASGFPIIGTGPAKFDVKGVDDGSNPKMFDELDIYVDKDAPFTGIMSIEGVKGTKRTAQLQGQVEGWLQVINASLDGYIAGLTRALKGKKGEDREKARAEYVNEHRGRVRQLYKHAQWISTQKRLSKKNKANVKKLLTKFRKFLRSTSTKEQVGKMAGWRAKDIAVFLIQMTNDKTIKDMGYESAIAAYSALHKTLEKVDSERLDKTVASINKRSVNVEAMFQGLDDNAKAELATITSGDDLLYYLDRRIEAIEDLAEDKVKAKVGILEDALKKIDNRNIRIGLYKTAISSLGTGKAIALPTTKYYASVGATKDDISKILKFYTDLNLLASSTPVDLQKKIKQKLLKSFKTYTAKATTHPVGKTAMSRGEVPRGFHGAVSRLNALKNQTAKEACDNVSAEDVKRFLKRYAQYHDIMMITLVYFYGTCKAYSKKSGKKDVTKMARNWFDYLRSAPWKLKVPKLESMNADEFEKWKPEGFLGPFWKIYAEDKTSGNYPKKTAEQFHDNIVEGPSSLVNLANQIANACDAKSNQDAYEKGLKFLADLVLKFGDIIYSTNAGNVNWELRSDGTVKPIASDDCLDAYRGAPRAPSGGGGGGGRPTTAAEFLKAEGFTRVADDDPAIPDAVPYFFVRADGQAMSDPSVPKDKDYGDDDILEEFPKYRLDTISIEVLGFYKKPEADDIYRVIEYTIEEEEQ